MSSHIKVWKLDDYDYWAGESLETVIAQARRVCGADTYEDAETIAVEFSLDQLDKLEYLDEDTNKVRTLGYDLREMLDYDLGFPCHLGSIE